MIVSQPSSGKYVLLGGMLVVGTIALAVYFITTLDRKVKDDTERINSQAATIASLQDQNNQLTQKLDAATQQNNNFSQTLQSMRQQLDAALQQVSQLTQQLNAAQQENQALKIANDGLQKQQNSLNAAVSPTQPVGNQPGIVEPQVQPEAGLTMLPGLVLTMTPLFFLAAGIGVFYKRKINKTKQEQRLDALQIKNALLAERIVEMRQCYWQELAQQHRPTR